MSTSTIRAGASTPQPLLAAQQSGNGYEHAGLRIEAFLHTKSISASRPDPGPGCRSDGRRPAQSLPISWLPAARRIIMVGAPRLPPVTVGMIEASAIRRLPTHARWRDPPTTASVVAPHLAGSRTRADAMRRLAG